MAEAGSAVVDFDGWREGQLGPHRWFGQENPQQVLQQSLDLWDLQELTAGDVAALLQEDERVVQRADVDHDFFLLCGEEDVHVSHVLVRRVLAARHHQDPRAQMRARLLRLLHLKNFELRFVAKCF